MDATDVIMAETQAVIDTHDEEAIRFFRDTLDEATGELDNALYELTEPNSEAYKEANA